MLLHWNIDSNLIQIFKKDVVVAILWSNIAAFVATLDIIHGHRWLWCFHLNSVRPKIYSEVNFLNILLFPCLFAI